MAMKEKGEGGKEVDLLMAFNGMAEEVIGELCFGEAFKNENDGQVSAVVLSGESI